MTHYLSRLQLPPLDFRRKLQTQVRPAPLAVAIFVLMFKGLQLKTFVPIGKFSLPPQIEPQKTVKTVLTVLANVNELMTHQS